MNWIDESVAVIGCGVMAQCLVDGWIKNKIFQAEKMTLTSLELHNLKAKYPKCTVTEDNNEAAKSASILFICVKPFMVEKVLSDIPSEFFKDKIVISIAAGLKLDFYHKILKNSGVKAIFRAMPNIAARVDSGMTAVCGQSAACNIYCCDELLNQTRAIFEPLGGWTGVEDEKLMDSVTALNGSALAFGCMAIEAMADGAVAMGLPRSMALSLSAHALKAASELHLKTGEHPALLRDQITTPAGCTIVGLLALEEGNFRSTVAKAVQETTRASKRLGEQN